MTSVAAAGELSAQQEVDEGLLTSGKSGATAGGVNAPPPTLDLPSGALTGTAAAGLLSPLPGGYESAAEEAAAALVDLSGASTITVDNYEASVPPNLAAASALLDELTRNGSMTLAARAGVYTLLDSAATLALTGD